MKARHQFIRWARPAAALQAVVLLTAHQAVAETAPPAAAPHTHTLFMGADLDLQQVKNFYRVENVEGGSFVIKVDGKEKKIPMKFSSVPLKVVHGLKLAETSIKVDKLVVERGYTPGNDPQTKFAASLGASAADAQVSSASYQVQVTQQALVAQRNSSNPGLGPGRYQIDYEQQAADALRNFNTSAGQLSSDVNSAGHGAGILAKELAEEMYDAIEITFEVSSDKPLNSPYAVVLAQFSALGAKPSEVQNWIYATELDPITPETHRVRIKQGGFPRGFVLKNHQVHLYNRGVEVATTIAPKRVELTREEAFDYVLIDYLSSNKGKTLPATLAMGRLSADVRNRVAAPALYVKVSKDGFPQGAFADEACTKKIEAPELAAALQDLRFKPALKEGKAVEGVARIGAS